MVAVRSIEPDSDAAASPEGLKTMIAAQPAEMNADLPVKVFPLRNWAGARRTRLANLHMNRFYKIA